MINFIKETIRSRRYLFLGSTLMTVLLKVSVIAPALLLGRIIDGLSAEEGLDVSYMSWLLIGLCGAVVLQAIFNPLQTYQLVSLVQMTLENKSVEWTKTIVGKEFEQFSDLRLGGLIKALERGITAHEKLLTFVIASGFPLVIEMGLIALIFTYVGGFGIFFVLMTISVVYIVFYHFLINWRRPYLSAVNAEEDQVCARLFETLQAGKAIKLEQACDHALKPLCESYAGYAQAATKVASTGAILGSVRILYLGLTTAGLLAWGVEDQLSGSPRLTIGNLVAVFSIAGMFLNNFSSLAEAYRTLDQFLVDKRKLQDVLALDDLMENEQTSVPLRISSLNLSPLHPETNRPLIFRAEQSVAIIGPSGAGKTTLLETLAGMPRARRRYLGFNDRQLEPSQIGAYLSRVRYCPQNPVFLEGVFSYSVLFGQDESSSLAHAIGALDLRELVSNRSISEGAKNISGGEAKRLSLLRIINRPGDFNLFDEPTASLDPESRLRVWDVVFSHFHTQGLVCVTHDLAALPRFDRVIVMKQGAVIADGPWFELAAEDGIAEIVTQISAITQTSDIR